MNIDSLERRCLPESKVTFLHGEANRLRCGYCRKRKNLTKKWIEHLKKGWRIKCNCRKRTHGKRSIEAAIYRTDVVLYDDPNDISEILIPKNVDCLLVVGCSLNSTVAGTAILLSSFKDIPVFYVNPDSPPKKYSKFIHVPIFSDDLAAFEIAEKPIQSLETNIDFDYWKSLIKSTFKKKYFTVGNLWNLVNPKIRNQIHCLLEHLVQMAFLKKQLHQYKVNYIK